MWCHPKSNPGSSVWNLLLKLISLIPFFQIFQAKTKPTEDTLHYRLSFTAVWCSRKSSEIHPEYHHISPLLQLLWPSPTITQGGLLGGPPAPVQHPVFPNFNLSNSGRDPPIRPPWTALYGFPRLHRPSRGDSASTSAPWRQRGSGLPFCSASKPQRRVGLRRELPRLIAPQSQSRAPHTRTPLS